MLGFRHTGLMTGSEGYPQPDATAMELGRTTTALAAANLQNLVMDAELAEAHALAGTDYKTNIPNERALVTEYERRVKSGQRFAVIFGDAANFGLLNKVAGHIGGDQALRALVESLQDSAKRSNDTLIFSEDNPNANHSKPADESQSGMIGRYGGDEFVLFFDLPDDEDGNRHSQKLDAFIDLLVSNFSNHPQVAKYNEYLRPHLSELRKDISLALRAKGAVWDPEDPAVNNLSLAKLLKLADPKAHEQQQEAEQAKRTRAQRMVSTLLRPAARILEWADPTETPVQNNPAFKRLSYTWPTDQDKD